MFARSRPSRILAALGIVAAAWSVVPPPAVAQDAPPPPGLGIRLLDVPRELAEDPRAQLYIIDHVIPGATIEREIQVSNGTHEPLEVQLYGVAASVDNGWSVADGRGGNDLAEWIDVAPGTVTVSPGERVSATATIRVPADVAGGERYAAIVAEAPAVAGSENMQIVNRVGVRVYLSVGAGPAPVTDFQISTFSAGRGADDQPYVLLGVTNTGERAIDVSGTLRLTDGPGSLEAGPFPVAFPVTIGPGDESSLTIPMDEALPAGPWLARTVQRSGLVERSAEATISFPEEAGTQAAPVDATPIEQQRAVLIPLASILFVVSLLAVMLVWFARRRRDDEDEQAVAGEVASEQPTSTGW